MDFREGKEFLKHTGIRLTSTLVLGVIERSARREASVGTDPGLLHAASGSQWWLFLRNETTIAGRFRSTPKVRAVAKGRRARGGTR